MSAPPSRTAQVAGSLLAAAAIVALTLVPVGARLPALQQDLPEVQEQREEEFDAAEEEAEQLEELREERADG